MNMWVTTNTKIFTSPFETSQCEVVSVHRVLSRAQKTGRTVIRLISAPGDRRYPKVGDTLGLYHETSAVYAVMPLRKLDNE